MPVHAAERAEIERPRNCAPVAAVDMTGERGHVRRCWGCQWVGPAVVIDARVVRGAEAAGAMRTVAAGDGAAGGLSGASHWAAGGAMWAGSAWGTRPMICNAQIAGMIPIDHGS